MSVSQESALTVADAAAGKEAIGHCLVLGLSDLTASWPLSWALIREKFWKTETENLADQGTE